MLTTGWSKHSSSSLKGHRMDITKDRLDQEALRAKSVKTELEVENMSEALDSIKWDSQGLAVAIAQHVDTGEILMQAFADRNAVNETLQTGYALAL